MKLIHRILLPFVALLCAVQASAVNHDIDVDQIVKQAVSRTIAAVSDTTIADLNQIPVYISDSSVAEENQYNKYEYKKEVARRFMEASISIVAILVFPVTVITLMVIYLRQKRNRLLDRYRLIENALRCGYQLPESFYTGSTPIDLSLRQLRTSLLWIGIGATLMLFFAICDTEEMVVLMLIPVVIGVARLIVYLTGRRQLRNSTRNQGSDAEQI